MKNDVLITGGGGMLAYALKRELATRGTTVYAPARSELDVTDETGVHNLVRRLQPGAIIQCAAYTRVDDAESHEDEAYRVNVLGTKIVAEAAREVGARFVFPSTDYVFDGKASKPYKPKDEPRPINAYGRTKLAGEQQAQGVAGHLVVRMSWLYGPGGKNFVRTISERLDAGESARVVADQFGRPTSTNAAAKGLIDLLESPAPAGIYHWANAGVATWFDVAMEIARRKGFVDRVEPVPGVQCPRPARRPAYSALDITDSETLIGPAIDWRIALADALMTGWH